MTRLRFALGFAALPVVWLAAVPAGAAPQLRKQVDQHGDFVLFGNTLGQECATNGTPAIPAPVVGTVGNCGTNLNDTSPDVFWRSDAPAVDQAEANNTITTAQARSTAVLKLPANAVVTYARIYWAGYLTGGGVAADTNVRIERPSAGLDTTVTSDDSATVSAGGNSIWYQSTADVTALVTAQGAGAYRISDVASVNLVDLNSENPAVAWSMVVFYRRGSEPPRNLALFDGLDRVANGAPASAALAGFLVPNAGFDAKLGVVAYEGEANLTGDSLVFNGTTLSDAVNPATNFFNGSRSLLGIPVSNVGDLPQLTGGPRSMSGIDMDVVDVTSLVKAGDKQATIQATSSNDQYLLGAFITSISTFKPDFATSGKTFTDINGGALRPGDELAYTITVKNTGNDASVNTVMTDALPAGITFVPGTIQIVSGANAGAKTDAAGDDQAEYTPGTRTLTVRLGTGANATTGGTMAIGETAVITFHATIDGNASGTISNQAVVTAGGKLGAPPVDFPTDGNGNAPGAPPTDVVVDLCETDGDCAAPTPFCNVTSSPKTCVACVTSSQCTDPATPDCNGTTHTCECATGAGTCVDTDGDGLSDGAEVALGTDPNDADSDDDGVPDGAELDPGADSDGDGLINALDPDSDNDGLFDGTEMGLGCSGAGTDASRGHCRPDADPSTTTNPLAWDTDGGGASDGSEDANLDGRMDSGETDPTSGHGADDSTVVDTDGDGLGDNLEKFLGSDPTDADSDDDGVLDGQEANPSDDTDGDKLINVLDVDSDNDGLFDGTEMGKGCDDPATDKSKNVCRADNDAGATKTSPLLRDTDHGGVSDGSEDVNLNGIVDGSETNPTAGHGSDDASVVDSDGDGLSDGLEATLGSDPNDADSDDDGVIDGQEPNPSADGDGDGKIDVLDPDSDGDGLFDGTEMGKDCSNAATDASKNSCVADADPTTTTSPVNPDTDRGGVSDGDEDTNKNGAIDSGERDPNNPLDDTVGQTCTADSDCGSAQSGVVCDATGKCVLGCRGQGGNGCPSGEVCSSTDNSIGQCQPTGTGGAGGQSGSGGSAGGGATSGSGGSAGGGANSGSGGTAASGGSAGTANVVNGVLEGGGCGCSVPRRDATDYRALALAFAAAGAWVSRRRRSR